MVFVSLTPTHLKQLSTFYNRRVFLRLCTALVSVLTSKGVKLLITGCIGYTTAKLWPARYWYYCTRLPHTPFNGGVPRRGSLIRAEALSDWRKPRRGECRTSSDVADRRSSATRLELCSIKTALFGNVMELGNHHGRLKSVSIESEFGSSWRDGGGSLVSFFTWRSLCKKGEQRRIPQEIRKKDGEENSGNQDVPSRSYSFAANEIYQQDTKMNSTTRSNEKGKDAVASKSFESRRSRALTVPFVILPIPPLRVQ